jgi:hypothetical protein
MPKDEFERLERRWRERPLFLDPPRRGPRWLLLLLLLLVGAFLGLAAIGPGPAERFIGELAGLRMEGDGETAQNIPVRLQRPDAGPGGGSR